MILWGTYPAAGLGTPPGTGEGLWLHSGAAARALELPAPSFLVRHPRLPLAYAACETSESAVVVVDLARASRHQLSVVATVPTRGDSACHLLLAPDARALYVSHYGSGSVAVIALGEDGLPVGDGPAQEFALLGTPTGAAGVPDRQAARHAHSAALAPGGAHVLVADLGSDELRRFRRTPHGLEPDGVAATLPPGAGPRHVATRGPLLYVACELDSTVRTLRWDPASSTATEIEAHPATAASPRTADNAPSHIALVEHDGREALLVGVRGADVISVFDVAPEGELAYRGAIDAGHWPRHFAVAGERLVVGCERGHEARTFALADVLTLPGWDPVVDLPHARAEITSPACALPL
ncbi:lactonase family protein [Demequina pelophila]|uniref:lactonase family protein n=1 Tax=Demequina pelophila TaxID=1638984 RepID=UPI000783C6F8|nr:beta-propeller fold lactonase family protein [Demequina pelophila]